MLAILENHRIKVFKICLAADVKDLQTLYKLIEDVGEHICILKIHCDIIHGFFDDLNETIKILKELQFKYNFLIWEDAKFADIGSVMKRKIDFVKQWADLVSIHPIAGPQSTKSHIGIILIGEMSSEGHLFTEDYQKKIVEIGNQNRNVVGIVCQYKMTTISNITPGISHDKR